LERSVLVYDIGGSHVSAALCHEAGYRLGPVISAPHPDQQSSAAFVGLLHTLGMEATADPGAAAGAELAIPGPFDYAAGVSWMQHKLPYLYGVDLRRALASRFGWKPEQVGFLNDAAAYLLGEVGAGAAQGAGRAVGFTLGTGIGSAFSVDGRVVTEGPGVPPGGEIWNVPYEGGIVEDVVSGRAIVANYRKRAGVEREVADLAAAAPCDPAAAEAFVEFGRNFGLALRKTLTAFAPQVVVLGGNISRSAHLFLPALRDALDGLPLELKVAALLDRAPLAGAGVAWFHQVASLSAEGKAAGAPASVV